MFLSARLLRPALSKTCEEVKLASGSGAQGARKVKYYHNALQGPRCYAVIGGKKKKTIDEVNDFIGVFVLHEKMTTHFLYRSGRIKHFPRQFSVFSLTVTSSAHPHTVCLSCSHTHTHTHTPCHGSPTQTHTCTHTHTPSYRGRLWRLCR